MADFIYNKFAEYMGDGTIDMDNDTFKIILLDDGHTPDATDTVYANVSGDELATASGYTAGGATLASVTWTEAAGTVTFDAANPAWTASTFTARYAVIYSDTAASDELVCLIDFTENKSVSGGTFTIQFNDSGIFTIAQS